MLVAASVGCFADEGPPERTDSSSGGPEPATSSSAGTSSTGSTSTSSSTASSASTSSVDTTESTSEDAATSSGSASTSDVSTDTTDATTDPWTTAESSSSTGDAPLDCAHVDLGSDVGTPVATRNSTTGSDLFDGSCGAATGREMVYAWRAPVTDFFVIDSRGSAIDTVLSAFAPDCEVPSELACHDNRPDDLTSELVVSATAGERFLFVLEGNGGEVGETTLNIAPVSCPATSLDDADFPLQLSTTGAANAHATACGGADAPERAVRYTAPAAGLYEFRAVSTDFAPILELRDGPTCDATPLQCHSGSANGLPAVVMRRLEEGESVTLMVDSADGAGAFTLEMERWDVPCPAATLEREYLGVLSEGAPAMSMSCAPSGELFNGEFERFDATSLTWTSPGQVGSNSGCTLRLEAQFPASLSLQTGSCDGAELECVGSSYLDGENTYAAEFTVGHIPPTTFTVTVARSSGQLTPSFGDDFTLTVGCFAVG